MDLDAILVSVASVAIVARALFSTADAALTGVSPERAEELRAARDTLSCRALLALKQDVEGTAATVRGGAITSLAIAAALAGVVSLRLLEPRAGASGLEPVLAAVLASTIGGVMAAISSFLELLPRSLAIARPEPWAERLAIPVRLCALWVSPLARLVRVVFDTLLAPTGVKSTFRAAAPALEDIERFLEEESKVDEDAPPAELIRSLFDFPTKIAREVMVPRTRVVAIPLDTSSVQLVRILAEEGHSRLPVYKDDIDHTIGILHTRDLVPLLANPELIKLADVIRPPVFVPWSTRIGHLLGTMQKKRIHMAMVTDEYGGFMGIVTLEDILEEIVGDIRDEHDEPEPKQIEPQPDGSWLVSTRIGINDLNESLGAALPANDGYETLAGFLNQTAGEIPDVGTTLQSHGFTFTITDRSPKRVRRVRIARADASPIRLDASHKQSTSKSEAPVH